MKQNKIKITDIKFSRHSKRRMKLYGLSEKVILQTIEKGEQIIQNDKTVYILKSKENKYPIKVVTIIDAEQLIIITAYPLKREEKNEN